MAVSRLLLFLWMFVSLHGVAEEQPEARPSPGPKEVNVRDLRVQLRAKGNGRPIVRGEIRYGTKVVYTDPEGVAVIVLDGSARDLEFARFGFEKATITEEEARESPEDLQVYLYPATPSDDEIIVRGRRRFDVSRKRVDAAEARKVAPGGDPAQVVKLLPGVQSELFDPRVVIRGSGPNDSRYYLDNQTVPFVYHRIGGLSVIPDPMLGEVEFYPGGFGPQYGGATGGVVVLRTKTEVPENPMTELRANVPFYSGVYHERPLSPSEGLYVSVRRSYLEFFVAMATRGKTSLSLVPYFGDAHAMYVKKGEEGGYSKFFLIGTVDGLKASTSTDGPGEGGRGTFALDSRYAGVSGEIARPAGAEATVTATPQYVVGREWIDILDDKLHFDTHSVGAPVEWRRRLGKDEFLYLGLEGWYRWVTADLRVPKPNFGDPFFDFEDAPRYDVQRKVTVATAGSWVAGDLRLGDWVMTPGLRASYESQIDRTELDPRLSARWELAPKNLLKASVGQYSQAPEPVEASEEFGNPNLQFERSVHTVVGWERDWNERWTTDLQLYTKRGYRLVRNAGESYLNSGSMRSQGAELFVRRNMTQRLFGWLAYSLSKTELRDSDQDPFRPPSNDQTHVVNLVGSYKISALWEVAARFKYHTGDRYTPIRDAAYNASLDKYQARPLPDDENAERLEDFHEMSIFAAKDFLADTWKLTLRFGIEYLALQRQVQSMQYSYDYSEKEPFRGLPPIPYLEMRGEF